MTLVSKQVIYAWRLRRKKKNRRGGVLPSFLSDDGLLRPYPTTSLSADGGDQYQVGPRVNRLRVTATPS